MRSEVGLDSLDNYGLVGEAPTEDRYEGASYAGEERTADIWVLDDPLPPERPSRPINKVTSRYSTRIRPLTAAVEAEINKAVPSARVVYAKRLMSSAVDAYENDRYREAIPPLETLQRLSDRISSSWELLGLCHYRMGNWLGAIKALHRLHTLTGSSDQDPVLCDCYRALKRWPELDEVWLRLKEHSPSRDIVNEGRIVYASSLSDRGRLQDAIRLLDLSVSKSKKADLSDIRQMYALAGLYESAGDMAKAKLLFRLVVQLDPTLYDAAERLVGLS